MGRDFADGFAGAADIFKRADGVLGFSISDLCFNGPEEALKETFNTQPALFATSCAAFSAAESVGLSPSFAAGHSLGEYAAVYGAGAFSFEDGLRLVRTRAELMDDAARDRPGAMAAVLGLSPDQVSEAVDRASDAGIVTVANFNSPIQTVISGEPDAVKRAAEIAVEMGAKRVVPLNVSGAFHSSLMQEAAGTMLMALRAATVEDVTIPVVANYTANFETTKEEVRENLAKQITGSVRWVESVQRLLDAGAEVFIELGAGNVLAGLIKRIAPDAEVYSVADKASLEALAG